MKPVPRRPIATAAMAAALAMACIGAAPAVAESPPPPRQLPGDASAAGVRANASSWIIGARPGPGSARLTRRFGARRFSEGGWLVDRTGRVTSRKPSTELACSATPSPTAWPSLLVRSRPIPSPRARAGATWWRHRT